MNFTGIAIFGTSGFGRELLDIGAANGVEQFAFLEMVDHAEEYEGFPIHTDTPETVRRLIDEGWVFAIGAGDPALRAKIAGNNPDCRFTNLIHPSATFGYKQRERLAEDTGIIVCAGCRITNSITFGAHVLLNLNTTVGHDTVLSDFVSVMPGVNISGNVTMAEHVYVGTGASIINGKNDSFLNIGARTLVGAGAVVTRELPADVVAVGMPARPRTRK